MSYHLICVHPFGRYEKGQRITNCDEVSRLMQDRDHHFVRVMADPMHQEPTEIDVNGVEYRRA